MADQDPEIQRQNSEATEANTRAKEVENRRILEMIATMATMAAGGRASADAFSNLTKATKDQTEAEKAHAIAEKAREQAKENYKNAVNSSKEALKQFAGTMLTTQTEFSKFSGAMTNAGDAALSLGKNFGLVGLAIGGLIKGATMAATAAMKQADNTLKASDELSKMGVAGGMTAKELLDMGHAAGYSSEQLGVIVKAAKSMGTDITALGGNVKQSMRAFGEMTNVGNDVYSSFQRLGVSQEDLTQNQADYVKLQASSGRMITEQMKRDGSLKQASLDYTKNLLELSAITGKSMEESKKAMERSQANFDIMIKTQTLEEEKNRLLESNNAGDKERAKQIQQELDANKAMLLAAEATGDAQFLAATQSRIATGAWTDSSTVLLRTLPNFEELQKGLKEGSITQADYMQAIAEGTQRQRQQLGTAAAFNKDLAEQSGLSMAMMQNSAKVLGKDLPGALKEVQKDIKDAAAGTGTGAGKDPAQIARNELTESTRNVSVGADKLLATFNPLLNGFNASTTAATALAAAAGAAALALGAIAGGKAVGGLLGKAGGGGGKGDGGFDPNTPPKEGHYKDASGRWRDSSGKYSKGPPSELQGSGKGGLGRAMGALGTAGKVLGKVAAPLAIASAGYDAYKGYNEADKNLGIKGREATTGEKMSSAAGSALSGLTFGLISSETISKGIAKATGAGPDKESEKKQADEAQLKSDKENTDVTKKLDSTSSSLIKALDALRMSVDALSGKITGGAPGGAGGGAPGGGGAGGGAPPSAGGAAPPKDQNVKGNLSSITEALKKKGIDDPNYIKAVLGNVMKETGGKNTTENLDYSKTSNDRIRKIFGSRAEGKSDEELNKIKGSQESMGEFMYGSGTKIGKSMGNTEAGDGWKYRGRGFIQLTGKNNYAAASQAIFGDDTLVKNPDAVMDPNVASQVVAWYMEKSKGKMQASMGLGSGPLSESDANLLATSQVAGRDVRKSSDYLKNELLGKVSDNAKNMGEFVDAPKTPQAAAGGIFSGPDSGYPVTLHGKEAVIPDFKIPDLIASLQDVSKKDLPEMSSTSSSSSSNNDATVAMMAEMIQMLSDKLDNVVSVLEDGNSTSNKILQYSQV